MRFVNTSLLTPSNMIAIGMILLFLITLMWAAMRLSSNTE